jgi:hypothetical protein
MEKEKNVRVLQSSIQEFVDIARDQVLTQKTRIPTYENELFAGPDVTRDLVNVASNMISLV